MRRFGWNSQEIEAILGKKIFGVFGYYGSTEERIAMAIIINKKSKEYQGIISYYSSFTVIGRVLLQSGMILFRFGRIIYRFGSFGGMEWMDWVSFRKG